MSALVLQYLAIGISAASLALLLVLLFRRPSGIAEVGEIIGRVSRENREEQSISSRGLREELGAASKAGQELLLQQLRDSREAMHQSLAEISASQQSHLAAVQQRLQELTESAAKQHEQLRDGFATHMRVLQEGNERKLDEMRATVDEKLHESLEKRLGESFAQVSERLEAVHRGLGEMRELAGGVGDLKRALTNVKVRGVWGEYQLQGILEQILAPDQYTHNFCPHGEGRASVEYAIKLPGGADGKPVHLPVDSKFPQEDYQRLIDAAEKADVKEVQDATNALLVAVRKSAQEICDKYIAPPKTTDIAILFLPTEGLYAEVLRQPGLVQELQERCHVVIAGPTTLAAILSSFRMGFRTLAIEQRSSEVWTVLGAVKTEFDKFGTVLDRAKKQLTTVVNTLDDTDVRTRAMKRRLREVESLPAAVATAELGLPEALSGQEMDEVRGDSGQALPG